MGAGPPAPEQRVVDIDGNEPIDPTIVGFVSEPVPVRWIDRDCMLYALAVGAGECDPFVDEIEFTTENSEEIEQRVLPTFATVVGTSRPAVPGFRGVALNRIVHGEHRVDLHQPLPVEGDVVSVSRITGVSDLGRHATIEVTTETVIDQPVR